MWRSAREKRTRSVVQGGAKKHASATRGELCPHNQPLLHPLPPIDQPLFAAFVRQHWFGPTIAVYIALFASTGMGLGAARGSAALGGKPYSRLLQGGFGPRSEGCCHLKNKLRYKVAPKTLDCRKTEARRVETCSRQPQSKWCLVPVSLPRDRHPPRLFLGIHRETDSEQIGVYTMDASDARKAFSVARERRSGYCPTLKALAFATGHAQHAGPRMQSHECHRLNCGLLCVNLNGLWDRNRQNQGSRPGRSGMRHGKLS